MANFASSSGAHRPVCFTPRASAGDGLANGTLRPGWRPHWFPPLIAFTRQDCNLNAEIFDAESGRLPVTHVHDRYASMTPGVWMHYARGCSTLQWDPGKSLVAANRLVAAVMVALLEEGCDLRCAYAAVQRAYATSHWHPKSKQEQLMREPERLQMIEEIRRVYELPRPHLCPTARLAANLSWVPRLSHKFSGTDALSDTLGLGLRRHGYDSVRLLYQPSGSVATEWKTEICAPPWGPAEPKPASCALHPLPPTPRRPPARSTRYRPPLAAALPLLHALSVCSAGDVRAFNVTAAMERRLPGSEAFLRSVQCRGAPCEPTPSFNWCMSCQGCFSGCREPYPTLTAAERTEPVAGGNAGTSGHADADVPRATHSLLSSRPPPNGTTLACPGNLSEAGLAAARFAFGSRQCAVALEEQTQRWPACVGQGSPARDHAAAYASCHTEPHLLRLRYRCSGCWQPRAVRCHVLPQGNCSCHAERGAEPEGETDEPSSPETEACVASVPSATQSLAGRISRWRHHCARGGAGGGEGGGAGGASALSDGTGPVDRAPKVAPLRVACLGDSNTLADHLNPSAAHSSSLAYPEALGLALGASFEVANFGVLGMGYCALASLWEAELRGQERLRRLWGQLQAFEPDIVVLMLGTNDVLHNCSRGEGFTEAVEQVLHQLWANTSATPPLALVLPPPLTRVELRQPSAADEARAEAAPDSGDGRPEWPQAAPSGRHHRSRQCAYWKHHCFDVSLLAELRLALLRGLSGLGSVEPARLSHCTRRPLLRVAAPPMSEMAHLTGLGAAAAHLYRANNALAPVVDDIHLAPQSAVLLARYVRDELLRWGAA